MDISGNNIEIIEKSVNLFRNQHSCDDKCTLIIEDVQDYLKTSREENDFILAVINLRKYNDFEDFFEKRINSKRRNQYRKAIKEGYYTRIIECEERNIRRDELYSINTSSTERQGKMADEYFKYPDEVNEYKCKFHFHKTYGVFTPDHKWIGYIYPRFCGEMVRTFRILGHAEYLGSINFMLLLVLDLIKDLYKNYPNVNYFMYHVMSSGNKGLQDWKKHAGFDPTRFTGNII
jgi:hypothetical protein